MKIFFLSRFKYLNIFFFSLGEALVFSLFVYQIKYIILKVQYFLLLIRFLVQFMSFIYFFRVEDQNLEFCRRFYMIIIIDWYNMSLGVFEIYYFNVIFKGLSGEWSWFIYGFVIIIWVLVCIVDVYVLGIEVNRFRFNYVRYIFIQYSDFFKIEGTQFDQRFCYIIFKQFKIYFSDSIFLGKE